MTRYASFLLDIIRHPVKGVGRCSFVLRNIPTLMFWQRMRREIQRWPDSERAKYADEIAALRVLPDMTTFPYFEQRESTCVSTGYDNNTKMSYVIHKGRRLYFRKDMGDVAVAYRYEVDCEGLLGTGRLQKSPHSYVDAKHFVEKGDVVLDVGCAEALFGLDSLDIASKVYLFECNPKWQAALQCTFGAYSEKVAMVSKLVSDKTDDENIRLEDAVKEASDVVFFVKMDIEGWEQTVIRASRDFLTSHMVKLSVCTYHRQEDAETISAMLKDMGFSVRFSDGYMLFGNQSPYFRKGMIYARNY